MTASLATARPFIFDTEFDSVGEVVRESAWRPAKRAYSPAEVEALIAQARLEARQSGLDEAQSLQADALALLARTVAEAAGALKQVAEAHRRESAELALACARVLAASAFDRFPAAPLQAAIEALGQEVDSSPRLIVRAPSLDAGSRTRIEALCADAGFSGLVVFRDEPAMPAAAFQLEWSDGRAEFDPPAVAARIESALSAALASEAGHAENLVDRSAL